MKKKKGPFEQSLDNVINKPKKITTHEIPITEQSIKQLSQDINAYVNRKEKERKPVVVKRPVIKQTNRMTGPFGSDTFYLRFIKGIKD